MTGLLICLVCGLACYTAASYSLVRGLQAVLAVGYFYGIVRSNLYDGFSHFIFDAAVGGFYVGFGSRFFITPRDPKLQILRRWITVLLAWPFLMAIFPIQDYLVQLVGLRGNAYFLPFMVCGFTLNRDEAFRVAVWLGILNLAVLVFGLAEFVMGIEPFYPQNDSTALIYRSRDVASGGDIALRIPATFPHAHGYAAAMVFSIPWLVGGLLIPGWTAAQGLLLGGGLFAAVLGAMLSATRSWIPGFMILVLFIAFSGRLRGGIWLGVAVILGSVFYIAFSEERLQRFTTLADADLVIERVYGSVNLNFVELLENYPLGNGMGGGGTSLPGFLQAKVRNPVGMENEYSRIMLEQGIPGLLMWLGFIGWLTSQFPQRLDNWDFGRQLLWISVLLTFLNGMIGTGLMIGVPGAAMTFLNLGFIFSGRMRSPPSNLPPSRSMF